MSIRRKVGDVVLVRTGDEEFLGRIDKLDAERGDECPQCFIDSSHDQHCREWPNVAVLNSEQIATGEWAFHISECEMFDLK